MKTVIEMAREAGFDYSGVELSWESVICTEELERFAELVRADEREACAKVCDDWPNGRDDVYSIGVAIRARSNT